MLQTDKQTGAAWLTYRICRELSSWWSEFPVPWAAWLWLYSADANQVSFPERSPPKSRKTWAWLHQGVYVFQGVGGAQVRGEIPSELLPLLEAAEPGGLMSVIARLRKPAEIPPGHTLQAVRLLPRLWEGNATPEDTHVP